jgi:hypothetical protein
VRSRRLEAVLLPAQWVLALPLGQLVLPGSAWRQDRATYTDDQTGDQASPAVTRGTQMLALITESSGRERRPVGRTRQLAAPGVAMAEAAAPR